VIFELSNCLLLVLPWVKLKQGKGDGKFPHYLYLATALAILGSGVVYWAWWAKVKPLFGKGKERVWVKGHKSVLSDEPFLMMRLERYGSGDGREEGEVTER
jgi:hypothetical protein